MHFWPQPREWGPVRTAGMWTVLLCPRVCSSNDCKRCWLMNERKITMHLLRSLAPAALQPPDVALWASFPAHRYLQPQIPTLTKGHLFTRSCYLPLQCKSACKQRLCASVQNYWDIPLHGFCAPGPTQESPQIPPQERLQEEGWEDKYMAGTW